MRAMWAVAVLVIGVTVFGCAGPLTRPGAEPSYVRAPQPRRGETIFSPIDLPAPTASRSASGVPGPAYWQQRADYTIEAVLDEDERTILGRAVITYTNNSPEALDYLWVHLEQNLFRPESAGALSVDPGTRFGYREGTQGGMEVRSVRAEGRELPHRVYDTLMRVDLPEPLAPGGDRLTFEITWTFRIPPFGADRLGMEDLGQGVVFQLAQWFPAVAKYDDVNGWNAMPYLGQGEFYTDFGDYDLRITVPRDHIVAATGVLENPEEVLTPTQIERLERAAQSAETVLIRSPEEVGDPASRPAGEGPLTWRFKAQDVRTVAWTSSPAFIWDAAGLVVGPEGAERHVLVQSVYPKEALPLWSKSTEMLRFAIEDYSERWHPYPYPTAVNVNGIVGGMEYPMIIFCRERHDERGLYDVTTHEIGHNWFPMLVNTDERRHAWMDEGFNTFINHYSMLARFGEDGEDADFMDEFATEMREAGPTPIVAYPDQIPRRELGYLAYGKPAVGLLLLREQILGPDRFDPAFRRYIREWAFKSPQPSDFFRCMEDAAGADLDWFWRGWFMETGLLDQAVADVEVDAREEVVRVTFENRGELVMPVVYRVFYGDGTEETRRLPVEAWFTTNRWTTQWPSRGRTVREVVIDPDRVFPDVDRENNVWTAE